MVRGSQPHRERQRDQRGTTLAEVLVAVAVVAAIVVGLVAGLATTIRVAAADRTATRTVALASGLSERLRLAAYEPCATPAQIHASLGMTAPDLVPTNQVSVLRVRYWDPTNTAFAARCPVAGGTPRDGGAQLVTISVRASPSGRARTFETVLRDPAARP